jgi:FkbM family methyltransferase
VWTVEQGKGLGLKIRTPQNLDYILGSSERPVQEALAQHLLPGAAFYDVGANVGFFSLIAARLVGPAGSVYSFEPVTENAVSIRRNAWLNHFTNVTVFEVAAGKASRKEELFLTGWDGGASLSSSVVRPLEPVSRRVVQVVALDDFVASEGLRMPGFVKIDVEGSEIDVINGMCRTITESKPVILFEVDDGNKDAFVRRWKEQDDLMRGFGYEVVHLDESYPAMKWNVGHSLALPLTPSGTK